MDVDFAVVTGAGRGIGRAIAQAIGAERAHVVCISRSAACEATARDINAGGGSAEAVAFDIANVEHAQRVVSDIVRRARPRRIGLVLAAAILGRPGGLLDGPPLPEWSKVFCTNVLGNLAILRACLPAMRDTRFGRVVALAGGGAAYGYPEFSSYALSKAALVRAIENVDLELRESGNFAFVALAPGAVETEMLAQVRAAGGRVRTTASPQEAAAFVTAFFSSKNAAALSGRFIHVRDDWTALLTAGARELPADQWKLRRIE
jgi:3-oxoacyl-[acyl-carrier protein] reductase